MIPSHYKKTIDLAQRAFLNVGAIRRQRFVRTPGHAAQTQDCLGQTRMPGHPATEGDLTPCSFTESSVAVSLSDGGLEIGSEGICAAAQGMGRIQTHPLARNEKDITHRL
ncbi:hypothetical protein AAFF_G00256770 [Aldrovandia affinis]|uniref:Uncharacterized protein n=1 Tax=Aldrovandia affinis TaxID=143900 RepID=A0AAD7ST65_9TELE|nr:hypothetical protein AAFF_G00256770 [Aldrovandia affinis]